MWSSYIIAWFFVCKVIWTSTFLCTQWTCNHLVFRTLTFAPRVKQDVNRFLMAVADSPIILQLRVYVHLPLTHDGVSCRCDLGRQHTKLKYTISYFQTDQNPILLYHWIKVINKLNGTGTCTSCWCSPSMLGSDLVRFIIVISIYLRVRTVPNPHHVSDLILRCGSHVLVQS